MNSFFDYELDPPFQFTSPQSHHQRGLHFPPQVASSLQCSSPSNSSPKRGIFTLQNDLLVYYAAENPHLPNMVLEINSARLSYLEPTQSNPSYGFKIIKNDTSLEFFSPTRHIIESWIAALKSICVLTRFHEEYVAIKSIGTGGFATVCLVESRKTKNPYAVKAFNKKFMYSYGKDRAKPALLNEIAMMRLFSHENIVKLYEVYETENSVYLVMELVKGRTLQQMLRKSYGKGEFTEAKVLKLMHEILQAVAHISSQGAMHRDLKPDNILIDKNDNVKIADFGLTTPVKTNYIFKKCGTPGYIAPEVFKYNEKIASTNYDSRCDVFSVGCIFFYMLFGFPFFNGYSVSEIIDMNQSFESTYQENINLIKRELSNSGSRIDKEALHLLLQLVEINPCKRVTATKALDHPYFSCILQIRKISSAGEPFDRQSSTSQNFKFPLQTFQSQQSSQANLDGKDESPGSGSFITGANKFAEKNSLYLDIGRANSLERSTDSLLSPTKMKPQEDWTVNSNNPLSPMGISNHKTLLKSISQNKTNPPNGKLFLKAAIFNNMQKQNDVNEEETVRETMRGRYVKRLKTDIVMQRPIAVSGKQEEVPKIEESCEVNGEEAHESHQINVNHLLDFLREKAPSKKAHNLTHR